MKNRNYLILIYFISGVILVTLSIQFYWNIKNYETERLRLIDELQASLDNAVDSYYTVLAKNNTLSLLIDNNSQKASTTQKIDSILKRIDLSSQGFKGLDSIKPGKIKSIHILKGLDSLRSDEIPHTSKLKSTDSTESSSVNPISFLKQYKGFDSLKSNPIGPKEFQKLINSGRKTQSDSLNPWAVFTSKIVVSITEDTLQLEKMDSLLNVELLRRDIDIAKSLEFINSKDVKQIVSPDIKRRSGLHTYSTSSFLPKDSSLNLYFTDIKTTIFKRIIGGIILSSVLMSAVIACLIFLLKIINRQKQLAEVKNDLISNITHEFKTPIATISVALEGIKNFNTENDPIKTDKYVNTSTNQLDKLTMMVEKLLETATLDGDELALNKEPVIVNNLLNNLITKHQTLAPQKHFSFEDSGDAIEVFADAFHLENALNNLLDNAVKYGGDSIVVGLFATKNTCQIKVSDSGKTLIKAEAKQIFEKFYRVPKGNTHDVKGFGIGLYYTKKIIEKHGGSISVAVNDKTTFKIELPYA
ncbi:two-component system phosphate regulon sensor histidine kinase PhoR [Leeuwenhoekiella aestuarii]|uniref:histidine kinase n=1 Tax=Leeuwenhoekiella aestuarii TaxID=2249426 RepID=A0A4Q0P006_9FLAO|nr:HAMP domain-containing sensor histidine kinase [Leeuwenhoekiella aestuarii]RXG18467.1 two-component system phosphate regulon sensor histidine kinase PhoR [Leeuwenhoekiella aestuarii]RXG19772.1 two-component system phosphate regulon sensor histidine kinase PhoR [Leeuwenhoekiella aestuarii]